MSKRIIRILGMGISLHDCLPNPEEGVEVWGLQYTWFTHKIHRLFVMDDRDWIVAKNKAVRTSHGVELSKTDIEKDIDALDIPVSVSHPWPGLRKCEVYPLEEVMGEFKELLHRVKTSEERPPYFMNSIAYMIALAVMQRPDRIEIYGIDMANQSGRDNQEYWEDERACVSFWAGVAVGRGIEFVVPSRSTITKPLVPAEGSLYGYIVSERLKNIRSGILGTEKEIQGKASGTPEQAMTQPIDLTKVPLQFYRNGDFDIKGGMLVPRNNAKPYHETRVEKDTLNRS